MSRRIAGVLLILCLVGAPAEAQYIAPGSTPQGDYLRGVGIAAYGMGVYNERTAVGNRLNAETFIMLNEYMWNVVKNENRENAEHRAAILARNAENYKKLRERIHDHPESLDVMNGGALNAKLQDLLNPTVSDSASGYAKVPLEADVIRRIPFQLGEKGATFSMIRLTLKGRDKWAVAFQDPIFASYRRPYEQAVENALELAIEGKMTEKAIEEIRKAVEDLEYKLMHTPYLLDPTNRIQFSEAKRQLERMRKTVDQFEILNLQQIFREIDTYAGTTVDDLRVFMRRHKLTFAAAETPDERTVYPQLYTALIEQRRKTTSE